MKWSEKLTRKSQLGTNYPDIIILSNSSETFLLESEVNTLRTYIFIKYVNLHLSQPFFNITGNIWILTDFQVKYKTKGNKF